MSPSVTLTVPSRLTALLTRRADRAALRAAVASLDERVPNWRDRLNPVTLDMRHRFSCVLGQLTGSYHRGITQLCPNHTWGDHVAACRAFDASFPVRLWLDELRRPATVDDRDAA